MRSKLNAYLPADEEFLVEAVRTWRKGSTEAEIRGEAKEMLEAIQRWRASLPDEDKT